MALFRRDVLQVAEKLVSKGKIEAAVKEYKKYLAKSPEDTSTLNRVGDLLVRLRKNDEAIEYYTRTADRYSTDGFFVKAIAVFKKIHRIEPSRIEVHRQLAELYERQGLISDARGHYQQLADHHLRDDAAEAAIGVYERLVDLEPDNPSHRLRLADLHRELGQFREAATAYGSIATLMLTHGQIHHAFQVYERAFQVDPQNLDFIREAVTSIHRAGGEETARQLLRAAIGINPEAQRFENLVAGEASAEPTPSKPRVETSRSSRSSSERPVPPQGAPATAGAEPLPAPSPLEAESGEWSFAPEPKLEEVELEFEVDLSPVESAGEMTVAPDVGEVVATGVERNLGSGLGGNLEEFELIEEPAPLPTPERTVGELAPVARESELLSEADVFIKYGLVQKALDRLNEILKLVPDHAGARARLILLHLELGEGDLVARRANELHGLVGEERDRAWSEVEAKLTEAGYRVVEGTVSRDSGASVHPSAEPVGEAAPASPLAPARTEAKSVSKPEGPIVDDDEPYELDLEPEDEATDLSSVFEEVAAAVERPQSDVDELEPVAVEVSPIEIGDFEVGDLEVGDVPDLGVADLEVADLEVGDLRDADLGDAELQGASSGVTEPELASAGQTSTDAGLGSADSSSTEFDASDFAAQIPSEKDSRVELPSKTPDASLEVAREVPVQGTGSPAWLDDVTDSPAGDDLFQEEQVFFDLAAELQEALAEDSDADARSPGDDDGERSLEEIVDGFKRGVAENISEEDADTHYNLGIAYREMMLLDEAIGEFQISAKDERFFVDSCAMLGLCFRDKGLPDLAVKWYRRALDQAEMVEDQRLGLLYDLGAAHEALEDRVSALSTYTEIYDSNSSYRDVGEKIGLLQP